MLRLFRCWLQLLLQPCPSARPGLARARRLRTPNAEAPPEGPLLEGIRVDAAGRVWMPCAREGRRPLENQERKMAYERERSGDHSPAPRPVKWAPAGA